jgi:hypothetical protein
MKEWIIVTFLIRNDTAQSCLLVTKQIPWLILEPYSHGLNFELLKNWCIETRFSWVQPVLLQLLTMSLYWWKPRGPANDIKFII